MQDLQITFSQGPMAGESNRYDLGSVLLGREPQPEAGQQVLLLRGSDNSVSRNHALLFERAGQVVLKNISANGTRVDGNLVMEDLVLKPGAKITIGDQSKFIVQWQLVGLQRDQESSQKKKESAAKVGSSGLLASPLVRTMLAAYIVAIIVLAAYMTWIGDRDTEIRNEWPELSEAYIQYQPADVDEEEKARRTMRAKALLVRLRVMRANDRDRAVKRLCRELMRLDADIESPIYLYGAKCLGSID